MKRKKIASAVTQIVLFIVMAIFLYPLIVMIFGAFKNEIELYGNPAGIPSHLSFENFERLVKYADGLFFRTYANSIFICTTYTVLSLTICLMAAYAFSKFEFKGRNVLFSIIIATIMIPAELKMPALYIMFGKMGILNTYIVQIVPTLASVFTMFMIRQYLYSISDSLLEAAKIDGANELGIFVKIIFPLASPVLGAVGILQFLARWNDYLWPSIMVTNTKKLPVMVILPTLNDTLDMYSNPMELILAGCVLVTVPLFIVFFLNQDKFMSSVTTGAVKG